MNGFLLVNKPSGWTSHDVVNKIKKKLGVSKIGHTGTLDPFASGLLILCVGKATKLAYLFSNLDKTYEGTIQFGSHYDTYDTTGKILDQKNVDVTNETIKKTVQQMIGSYQQMPPMYSAIKIDGQKLYELARKGIEIQRIRRQVNIYDFKTISVLNDFHIDFFVSVSKGTYIRSLAVDLADKLNTYGALSRLIRTSVGNYDLSIAKTIEEITVDDLYDLKDYFKEFPSVILNDYMIKLVKNGVVLDDRQIEINTPFIVKDQDHQMIAYYEVVSHNTYKPIIIF